ncbi:MAG: hypothetical protein ACRCTY_04195 [Candidatus Adiutrix sp.]
MIILTIDTDWAPQAAVEDVLTRVQALGLKHTVFFSEPPTMALGPQVELGCHPDFLGSHTPPKAPKHDEAIMAPPQTGRGAEPQGVIEQDESAIIKGYRQAFPTASAIRTHRFFWHSDLSRLFVGHDFLNDSSLILPFHPGLCGFTVGKLRRWPVWSSDHLHLARKLPLNRLEMPNFNAPGLKIFCFHVAYLYLNSSSLAGFNMINHQITEKHKSYQNHKCGVWNLFELLAEKIYKKGQGVWLGELPLKQF